MLLETLTVIFKLLSN
ncbi:Protein of unknown function [Lactobacillus acidophilus DSM 9126]|nr:Protein of unknown function [Lactobacillus acidophilus DSM 20079 = JCM 1132 = NBRC 13951 = CIP 76.13]CDF69327.1 Protein of unknown function [Lactobacillus acidophilus CIRM-BIA 442]CDF71097.1 Protein of unknown function [Lactobacillus acidophilus CIRM-BIA 445]CDF72914.1 Protein of unknown function [Lactobacillus acidophilus DSM 9126]CDF74901.1 Protein of unknown function [Lactobacillus acidophilus DSM 20242]